MYALIHSTLIKEQKLLMKLLREGLGKEGSVQAFYGGNCHSNVYLENKKTSIKDYRNYMWICVIYHEKRYWLTLFYNDVDEKSGNFHTQFGRIQFWKNIERNLNRRYGINKQSDKDKTLWHYNKKDMYDPFVWIDSPDYKRKEVVQMFINFIKKDNKEKGVEINESKKQENSNDYNNIIFGKCSNCCCHFNN